MLKLPSVLAEHAECIVHWNIILILRLSANESITYGTDRQNDCYAMEKLARCDLLDDYEEGMRQSEKCDAFLMDSK